MPVSKKIKEDTIPEQVKDKPVVIKGGKKTAAVESTENVIDLRFAHVIKDLFLCSISPKHPVKLEADHHAQGRRKGMTLL